MTIQEKRKNITALVYRIMSALDPTGTNTKYYKDLFEKMNDQQFDRWAREFFKDNKQNFYLEIIEYDKSREITYDKIEKAAKILGVPLFETVYIPYINHDMNNICVTPQPVPVGYIHIKRMMQTLEKKNSGTTSISKRSPITGQVTGDDKNGRNSDVETYSMLAIGAEKGLAELMGPRADDMTAKNQMLSQIANNGYVHLADLDNDPLNKTSLNTLDMYFLMQGLRTNLVKSGDLLPMPDVIEPDQKE